jgi:hypothetical protein
MEQKKVDSQIVILSFPVKLRKIIRICHQLKNGSFLLRLHLPQPPLMSCPDGGEDRASFDDLVLPLHLVDAHGGGHRQKLPPIS